MNAPDTSGCYGDLLTLHCSGVWWLIPLVMLVAGALGFAWLVMVYRARKRYPPGDRRSIHIPAWQAFVIYIISSFLGQYAGMALRNFWLGLLVFSAGLGLTYLLDETYRRRARPSDKRPTSPI